MKYLLKGDISGIQEFIFNVSSKGAAKSLKAKSYLIQVIGELACNYCMTELDKAEMNPKVFYNGGGNFFIEFETEITDGAKTEINRQQKDINDELRTDEFAVSLAFVEYGTDFGDTWTRLRQQSNINKLKMFQENIKFFCPYDREAEEVEQNEDRLPKNIKQLLISLKDSNRLHKAICNRMIKKGKFKYNLLSGSLQKTPEVFKDELTNKVPLWRNCPSALRRDYTVYRERTERDLPENEKSNLGDNDIIDFNAYGDFAELRTGTNKIGVLKLDVDNLGELFGKQSTEDGAKKMSDEFRSFFNQSLFTLYNTGFFPYLEESIQYRWNIYPIFSGGDDCFIVGAWDAILYFCKDLQAQFNVKFTDVTLSAGIIIINPSHPVKSFTEHAEEALSSAKGRMNEKGEKKNAICIFDMTFSWTDYQYIVDTSTELRNDMSSNPDIDRSFLDKVRRSAKGFNALQNTGGVDFSRIYKLKYYLSRHDGKLKLITDKLFNPYFDNLKNKLLNKPEMEYDTAVYPTIARITELLTKEKLKL